MEVVDADVLLTVSLLTLTPVLVTGTEVATVEEFELVPLV